MIFIYFDVKQRQRANVADDPMRSGLIDHETTTTQSQRWGCKETEKKRQRRRQGQIRARARAR